jgi:hypothetical protein
MCWSRGALAGSLEPSAHEGYHRLASPAKHDEPTVTGTLGGLCFA